MGWRLFYSYFRFLILHGVTVPIPASAMSQSIQHFVTSSFRSGRMSTLSFLWNEEKYRTWVAKEQRKKDKLAPDNVWDGLVHRADGREGVLVDETETETATVVNRLLPRKTPGLVESVVPTAKGRGRHGKSSSK